MADPKFSHGTCLHCDKRVLYKAAELSPEQKAENEAARAHNQENHLGRWDTDFQATPHENPSYWRRWTHDPEAPGEDNTFCEGWTMEENRYGTNKVGHRARPKEFCLDTLNNGDTCHKQVKMEVDGIGYCLVHGKKRQEIADDRAAAQQEMEIRQWAEEALLEEAKALSEKYGISVDPFSSHDRSVNLKSEEFLNLYCPAEKAAMAAATTALVTAQEVLNDKIRALREAGIRARYGDRFVGGIEAVQKILEEAVGD